MSPLARRVLQAALYEAGAILSVTPMMAWLFDRPAGSAFLVSVVMSTVAVAWNYLFNLMFERWESRQVVRGRSTARRVAHGIGFEGGLALLLVPVVAFGLDVSFWEALLADLGLLLYFLVYTVAFTWVFDRVFGLPASAR